ncbi:uncharacterized protein [Polyergus mexicanus]|uniref:uncharacterized protein n=1 Tax=Polyergus mexicanus TaxID=615972 RepID=UPI0038B4F106
MPKEREATIIVDDEESKVNRIAVRIPPFWPEEPELWFAQLEGQFSLCGVTQDEAKYAYVLSKIEPRQAREIKDVITHPPAHHKYEAIKKALIQRLTDSHETRIKQLLEREELGDRRPSQFLRHLSTLAGTTVPNELLRTLWLGRLPQHMQAILATRNNDNLEEVAEQADRIHEIGNNKALVFATSAETTNKKPWEEQIQALSRQVAALTTQMANATKRWDRERGRSRQRNRSGNRARSKTTRQEGVCFYHQRFGEKARKCTQPCTYKKNEEGSR